MATKPLSDYERGVLAVMWNYKRLQFKEILSLSKLLWADCERTLIQLRLKGFLNKNKEKSGIFWTISSKIDENLIKSLIKEDFIDKIDGESGYF